jgi:DNA segregation ATPase FtsK/SpoIIIE-like protein
MNIFFHEKKRVFWYINLCLYSCMILFLVVSLVSYNLTDSSWLYVSSEPRSILNQAGSFGAHLAAVLYYLLGGASFLLLLPLLCYGFIVMTKRPIWSHWERLCASLYLVVGSAMVLSTYIIDFAWSPYPGGIVGLIGAQKLVYYFDPLGRILFLYMSLCASLILLFRWSFMFLVQNCIAAIVGICTIMKKYHVVSRTVQAIKIALHIIFIRIPVCFATFIQSLCDGSAFQDTGLIHPEDDFQDHDEYLTINDTYDDEEQKPSDVTYITLSLPDDISIENKKIIVASMVLSLSQGQKKHVTQVFEEFTEKIQQKKVSSTIIKQAPRYDLPHMNIFVAEKRSNENHDIEKELQDRAHVLEDKLKRFGVNGQVVAIKRGPVVTLFEYQPDVDTKLSKIIVLEDDLAMALQAMSIRIIAPIPGRSVVGFEVANTTRHDVLFSQITNQDAYAKFSGSLPLVLGKGTIGEAVVVDLARMPHLLIAGSTGSGKSVALNAILISLLCKLSPDDLKLILIDPKRLEFAAFTDIAHLLFPIVTSPHQAAPVLRWVVQEMEDRYEKMAQCGARNIGDYNERILRYVFEDKNTQGERESNGQGRSNDAQKPLPFIVVVIDELADLMITVGRDIEDLITRITQMARAAGIHMIVATQRPSVDVITGLIKANFPSRISFRVASRIDSRTILDTMGADRLLGRGDMLFIDASTSQLRRVHGAYVSDEEIEQVADHIRKQRKVEYLDLHQVTTIQGQDLLATDDTLYKDVREFLDEIDEISISLLQRKFRIGYNRSARIIDLLESQGLIMPQDGSKTRKVIR